MQSTYSNYDSDGFITGSTNKLGGLNPNQEFRPQPQKVTTGAGLLIAVKTDVIGQVSVDFTNIITEPYAFTQIFTIVSSDLDEAFGNFTVASKTYLVSIQAINFRIRFRNKSPYKQNILKLFTFILPSSPVISINPDTVPVIPTDIFDSVHKPLLGTDSRLNTYAALMDGTYNKINSIIPSTNTNRALYTHNVYDYSNNLITFTINSPNIISTSLELKKYKNFDVIFESITAINLLPVRLYVYVSKDNTIYVQTNYYIDIYYGNTTKILTNVTVNGNFIKLQGIYITGLTINTCYVSMKG